DHLTILSHFLYITPPPPRSPLFPYTTLFRSGRPAAYADEPDGGAGEGTPCDRRQARGRAARDAARRRRDDGPERPSAGASLRRRSEEHTSELQSRGHLVCRLLLEKKKNKESE